GVERQRDAVLDADVAVVGAEAHTLGPAARLQHEADRQGTAALGLQVRVAFLDLAITLTLVLVAGGRTRTPRIGDLELVGLQRVAEEQFAITGSAHVGRTGGAEAYPVERGKLGRQTPG